MLNLHYFNGRLSQGFVALYSGRMIQFIANGLTNLFVPVFILKILNFDIVLTLVYFLSGNLIYALILPAGAMLLNRVGMRRAIRLSTVFEALFYVCLFFVKSNVPLFLILSIIFLTLNRMLFWLPYHVDFAKFTDRSNRCKEVSLLWATKSILSIIMPVISGFLIGWYGFNVVFLFTIILVLTVAIPYMALPRTKEKFEWSFLETFENFFKKENKNFVVSNIANGAESGIAMILWPIFIWQIFKGSYIAVGVVSSLIVLLTVVIQLLVGRYADIFSKRKLLHWGSALYASGWMAKIFIITAPQTFIVGAYHSITQIFKDTPFEGLNYELLADHGHYIDEYTVLKEIAVQFGKVLIFILAIFVVANFGINWTFALAALASLMINFL